MNLHTAKVVVEIDVERDWLDGLKAIDEQYDEAESSRKRWVRIGSGLLAGRLKCPADIDYGEWLNATGYRVIKDDERQDAMWLAVNAAIVMPAMLETRTGNPCWVRRSVRVNLPIIYTQCQEPRSVTERYVTESLDIIFPETHAEPSSAPIQSLPVSTEVVEKSLVSQPHHTILNSRGQPIKNLSNTALAKTFGLSAADVEALLSAYAPAPRQTFSAELIKLHHNHKARKRAGELVRLAVEVAKSGEAPALKSNYDLDARMFWPYLPEAFCKHLDVSAANLAKQFYRLSLINAKVAEMMARGASAHDLHNEINHLWAHGTERPKSVPKAVVIPAESKIKHEVKFCGERIWPSDSLKVSDADLNTGWHLAHHWISYLATARPQKPNEIAVLLAQLIGDIEEATTKEGLVAAMRACLGAFLKVNNNAQTVNLSNSTAPGLKLKT